MAEIQHRTISQLKNLSCIKLKSICTAKITILFFSNARIDFTIFTNNGYIIISKYVSYNYALKL